MLFVLFCWFGLAVVDFAVEFMSDAVALPLSLSAAIEVGIFRARSSLLLLHQHYLTITLRDLLRSGPIIAND